MEKELIKQYKEYIEFLDRANKGAIQIAALHGWQCSQEDIEEGITRRQRIDALTSSINSF